MKKLGSLKGLLAVSDACKNAGVIETEEAQNLLRLMVDNLENLPINMEQVEKKRIRGFVLAGDEWFPLHVMNRLANNVIEYAIHYTYGYEDGMASLGKWADATMDDTPNLPEEFWAKIGLKNNEPVGA